MRGNLDFSLYPFGYYAIAKLPLDEPLSALHTSLDDRLRTTMRGRKKVNGIEVVVLEGNVNDLMIYWSDERHEWIVFSILKIPVDMLGSDTNYAAAHALNLFCKRKLGEAFEITDPMVWQHIEKTTPEELEKLGAQSPISQ